MTEDQMVQSKMGTKRETLFHPRINKKIYRCECHKVASDIHIKEKAHAREIRFHNKRGKHEQLTNVLSIFHKSDERERERKRIMVGRVKLIID